MHYAITAQELISLDLKNLSVAVRSLSVAVRSLTVTGIALDRDEGEVAERLGGAPAGLSVTYGNHWFSVSPEEGAFAEQACRAMSVIQEDVIDDLGRGWPELVVDGHFAGLLEPHACGDLALWASAKGFSCPLGSLADAFGSLIRW